MSQKKRPPNPKQEVFFTGSYCSGMKESVFGKSDRIKVNTLVEMIKLNKNILERDQRLTAGHWPLVSKNISKHDLR